MKEVKLDILKMSAILMAMFACNTIAQATHEHKNMDHSKPKESTLQVEVITGGSTPIGTKNAVKLKLTSKEDGKEILLEDLKEAHTKKIHVLIFDQSLTDYQHVHPEPTKEPGVYQFDWTPKNDGVYRLWVDVVPLETGQEEYIRTNLATVGETSKTVDKIVTLNQKIQDNWYTLTFDNDTLKKGQAAMGTIKVVDAQGHDFKALEPIMGAYAHIVAINEDFETIAHVHPMGEEPSKESDRGGPTLSFHFEPKKAGYYKIWLQAQIGRKDVYVPFGVEVE